MAHDKSRLKTALVVAMLVLLSAGVFAAGYGVHAKIHVGSLTFSPDSRNLAVICSNGVTFYESASGEVVFEAPVGRKAVFSRDSRCVAVSTHREIAIYEIPSGDQRASYQAEGGYIRSMAFSSDGELLAVLGTGPDLLLVLDTQTLSLRWSVQAHEDVDSALAFSPDGRIIATGGSDLKAKSCQIRMWDSEQGTLVQTIEVDRHAYVDQAVFINGGKALVVVFSDRQENNVYDISNLEDIGEIPGHPLAIYSGPIVLSQDGHYAAMFFRTGGSWGRAASVVDVQTGRPLMHTGTDIGRDWDFVFEPKNESLLLATSAGTVSTWDLSSGRRLGTISGVRPSQSVGHWYLFGGGCAVWLFAWIAAHLAQPSLFKGNADCVLVPFNGAVAIGVVLRGHWLLNADPWRAPDRLSSFDILPFLPIGCLVVLGITALATRSGHAFVMAVVSFLGLFLLSAVLWLTVASSV